ncbi:MAG: cytochrome P450 [Ilumatobacteraceae bacterium]
MPHTSLRRLLTQPFTLRRMAEYTDATRAIVDELLDAMIGAGPVDVVRMPSEPLPIRVIVSILGIPRGRRLPGAPVEPARRGHQRSRAGSPRTATPPRSSCCRSTALAAHALFEFGRTRRRATGEPRRRPGVEADHREVDGDHLTDAEFCNFFQLLVFAGNETTRTAISNGLIAFMQHPEQLQRLQDDPSLIPNAVEEVIRWATPVLHMRRTATADTELHGTRIAAGDWVVIWYASANFDEAAFERPLEFDVARPVKPEHVAFGAFGPHHCLGAPLARLEIRLLLEQLVARRIRIEAAGIPARVRSNFVNGVLSLPAVVAAG